MSASKKGLHGRAGILKLFPDMLVHRITNSSGAMIAVFSLLMLMVGGERLRAADQTGLPRGPVTNPLAAGAASQGTAGQMVRLKPTSIPDPMIDNVSAGTILVPEGWTMKAGIIWTWDPYCRVSLHSYILAPDGRGLTTYPVGTYVAPFGFFREGGQNYLGKKILRQMGPDQYILQVLIPKVRQELAQAKIVSSNPSPEYQKLVDGLYAGTGTKGEAVKMRLEYPLNGQDIEEDIYCCIESVQTPATQTVAWTSNAVSFRAPKGELEKNMGLYLFILSSRKANIRWAMAVDQLNQQLIRNYAQQSDAALKTSMRIAMDQQQISADIQKAYDDRQRAVDHSLANFSQATLSQETYRTGDGTVVVVPNNYQQYYSNQAGEVLLVKDAHNFHPDPDWHLMERVTN
jgi:hypothetical protein